MTDERFTQLVNGPLSHPLIPFTILRLAAALRVVVESHPDAAKAFEDYCQRREQMDKEADGLPPTL